MDKLQLNGQRLKALIQLHFSKYVKNSGTMCDFERELGYSSGHPGIRALFKYLIKRKSMILIKTTLGVNFYSIDRKALRIIIEEQEILNEHIKYIDNVAYLFT